jgi:hypothetical protein
MASEKSAPCGAADELAEADSLFAQGGLENLQQSIALTLKAMEQNPGSFEANWNCARAHREAGMNRFSLAGEPFTENSPTSNSCYRIESHFAGFAVYDNQRQGDYVS